MAYIDIPTPRSSQPGQEPGEGNGRLINCYCEIDGDVVTWRPIAGLIQFSDTGQTIPRGMQDVANTLYAAFKDKVVSLTTSGVPTVLSGALLGSGKVTWARNNRVGGPDVVCVTENGASVVTPTAVAAFTDPDLPQPNSCCVLDGFIFFSIGDGRIFATGLNDITIDALSFTTCESNPDGLLRVIVSGEILYACGQNTIEPYIDQGLTPFPLSRATTIPVGIIGTHAIAGDASGWSNQLHFVASDATVRRIDGYQTTIVSNADVQRAIQNTVDKSLIEACVITSAGNPFLKISASDWTWVLNVKTGLWHEEASINQDRWRGSTSIKFNGDWIVGDVTSGQLHRVSEAAFTEAGAEIAMTIEHGQVKQFPLRLASYSSFFDWTVGQGAISGTTDATDPSVSISYSLDGGGHWSTPVIRSIGKQGEYNKEVRVNRMNGRLTHHGLTVRQVSTSPVYRTFRGARMEPMTRQAG